MEALQRIVKKLSNEIIDLKKNCGEGSSNPKKFFIFTPKKEKSTPPTTKTTPPSEGINMEDFVQALKAWEIDTQNESKEEEEGEAEQHDQSQETDETEEKEVNSFWDISFGLGEEEEEEVEEIHLSQNAVTTKSASKASSSNPPSSSETTKTTSNTQNTPLVIIKLLSSTPSKFDYDFLEDLKRLKRIYLCLNS
jgi:hypothetical protein